MFRRSASALLLVAGLALTVAACGGSSSSSSTDTSGAKASGAGDAQAVLASIKTNVGDQGPQKIAVEFDATVSGSPKDPSLGAFLGKPITIKLDGPIDTILVPGALRFDGKEPRPVVDPDLVAWLQGPVAQRAERVAVRVGFGETAQRRQFGPMGAQEFEVNRLHQFGWNSRRHNAT